MSRLCNLKLCSVIKSTKTPDALSSRFYFKAGERFDNTLCQNCRGYAQYSLQLAPRIYPLCKLLDRIFPNRPAIFSTNTKERYEKDSNKFNKRHYRHSGMLLGSLGLILVFCNASHFTGICVGYYLFCIR